MVEKYPSRREQSLAVPKMSAVLAGLACTTARPSNVLPSNRPSTAPTAVGACVVCYAISTSRGTLVAKLDDVTIRDGWQGRGVGSAMLGALGAHLRERNITRIDTACHRDNAGAWRFYRRLGFAPLDEERIALLLQ